MFTYFDISAGPNDSEAERGPFQNPETSDGSAFAPESCLLRRLRMGIIGTRLDSWLSLSA